MLLLGVALAAAGGLTAATMVAASGHHSSVLVADKPVAAGHVITRADLATASVSGTGMGVIPARQESAVAGRTAAVGIQPGTLLVPGDLASAPVPGPRQQLVPVALKSSQLPASGLADGDQVLVFATPGAGGQAGSATAQVLQGQVAATVFQVSAADQSGDVTVDLLTPTAQGTDVARQASTGQIALVVTSAGG